MDYIPHQIHLTKQQVRKLGKGLATNIKHAQMGADKGDYVVMLHPQNARKMLNNYKKNMGMRLQLTPEEMMATEQHGSGFFKSLKKLTGINKTDIIGSAKKAGKELVKHGAKAVEGAIGAYTGNPLLARTIATAVEKAGDRVVDSVEPSHSKYGVKFDVSEGLRGLKDDAKQIAYEAVEEKIKSLPQGQREVAETAVRQLSGFGLGKRPKKGSPEMKEYMAQLRARKGGKLNIGKAFKHLGHEIQNEVIKPLSSKKAISVYKDIGKQVIQHGIPTITSGLSMLAGDPTGISGATMGGVASDYLTDAYTKAVGKGLRPRGRPRKQGAGVASLSKPYKEALKYNYGGLEVASFSNNAPVSDFKTNPRVKPSSPEMTMSPYQKLDSPAMNPFTPTRYTQEGGTSNGYGGRGLYGGGLYGGGLF